MSEERFRLQSEVEARFVDEDVRCVDLNLERSSSILVLLVVQSQVQLEVVLVRKDQFVLDGQIFGVVAVDDREATPLEN